MALDLRQHFVSTHYLENKLIEFHQILHMPSYWQDLRWDCYTSFFTHLYQCCGPLFTPKFWFRSISREQIDRISPNLIYMHSYWQDLHWDCYISFFAHLYQSYGPWFMPKICFPSISWEQMNRSSPNFIYAFILTRSMLGLLRINFRTFVPKLWPFIHAKFCFCTISWEQN